MAPNVRRELVDAMEAKHVNPKGRKCLACGLTELHLDDQFTGIALGDGQGEFNMPMLKCALVQCGKCGFIMLYNAAVLGVQL